MLERDELVNLLVMRPQASGRDAQQSRHDFKSPVDRRSFIDALPPPHADAMTIPAEIPAELVAALHRATVLLVLDCRLYLESLPPVARENTVRKIEAGEIHVGPPPRPPTNT